MAIEVKVPQAGESVSEVEIGPWLKKEGEAVELDEPLVEIETDKASMELAAPASGRLGRILKKQGERAAVGEVIALLEEAPAGATEASGVAAAPAEASPAPAAAPAAALAAAAAPRVMPAAARLLGEHGLEAGEVAATGPGGRLLKEDVARHVAGVAATPAAPAPPSAQTAVPATVPTTAPTTAAAGREEEVVAMSLIRRRIAERLLQARRDTAMLTTFNEIDMTAVIALRKEHGASFQERHGVKLGFMSFFVKAAVDALFRVPEVNASIRGDDIVYHRYADIGVAVGSGRGLVVPVLRNAERLRFAEVEKAIVDFSRRAQDGKLKVEELQGGTFTISNGGIYGSLLSTPILNPPQTGILGMHAIQDRPVAVAGQVVVRPMMYVALSYDHRLIDGREAVTFLRRIKDGIESPARLLLEA